MGKDHTQTIRIHEVRITVAYLGLELLDSLRVGITFLGLRLIEHTLLRQCASPQLHCDFSAVSQAAVVNGPEPTFSEDPLEVIGDGLQL